MNRREGFQDIVAQVARRPPTAPDSAREWPTEQEAGPMARGVELGYAAAIGEVVEWLQVAGPESGWAERVAQRFTEEKDS